MPSLMAILGLDASGFKGGLEAAKVHADRAGVDIGSALGGKLKMALGAAGVAASIGGIFEQLVELAAKAREIEHGSARLGVNTDTFQQRQKAAEKYGSSIDAVFTAYKKLAVTQQSALGGDKGAIKDFKELGVSMEQLKAQSVDQLFQRISINLGQGAINGAQLAAMIGTMGRGADELRGAFAAGAFQKENPYAIKSDDIEALNEFYTLWKKTKAEVGSVGTQLKITLAKDVVGLLGLFGVSAAKQEEKSVDDGILATIEAQAEAEKEKTKAVREQVSLAQRLESLLERTAQATKRYAMGDMNDAQKIAYLNKRNAELKKQKFDETDEGRVKAQERDLEITENMVEIQSLRKAHKGDGRLQTNELQRIGAYSSQNSLQDQAVRAQIEVPRKLDKLIDQTKPPTAAPNSGTTY